MLGYTCIATKPEMSMLAIRLPKEIEDRLTSLAKKTGRKKTYYAREAILTYLDDLEDIYLAEQRLHDGKPTISHKDVEKDLGLDD